MNKKIFYLAGTLTIAVICVGISVIATSPMRQIGSERKVMESSDPSAVMKINGESISSTSFQTYKSLMKQSNSSITDEEIQEKYIRQRIIFQEAEKQGYSASEQEINDYVEAQFSVLNDYPEAYQIIEDYVDGLGITMEEYKERSKEVAEQAIISTKLKKAMESEYLSRNTYSARENTAAEAEKYYEDYIDEQVSKADVEILK